MVVVVGMKVMPIESTMATQKVVETGTADEGTWLELSVVWHETI